MAKTIAPYGTWKSPIALEQLFERPSPPMYPEAHQGQIYWIEERGKEGGRRVLVRRDPDDAESTLTPEGFNIRTRVHEYGGRCHCLVDDHVYFSNYSDQRLYVQRLESTAIPQPLTPVRNVDGSVGNYADIKVTPDKQCLVFIYEQAYSDVENVNSIAYISLSSQRGYDGALEPITLATGEDFYANPVISSDGHRIAWLQWRHPDMPWDQAEVVLGTIESNGGRLGVSDASVVAGGTDCSVCQLLFGEDATLYFVMDRGHQEDSPDSFWNVYRYKDGQVHRLTSDLAEYGAPHWIFGETRYAQIDTERLVAIRTRAGVDELVYVDTRNGNTVPVQSEYVSLSQIHAVKSSSDETQTRAALMIAASSTEPAALVRLDVDSSCFEIIKSCPSVLDPADVSVADSLHYPTADGATAHAYFYPPNNSSFAAPAGTRPPLMVLVHGGPTSRTDCALAEVRQYWTTMGYAVLDVNHRGSSGFGRDYRQALLGRWGEIDVSDIVDGIEYLIGQARIDPTQVCIRGGSAGGYAVLRTLTRFPERFSAGASYYGIGNLVTLAHTTHKFEAHYLDGLIGEVFNEERARRSDSAYHLRSPVNFMDRLRSPMILFQGEDDKVVPPEVSREVVHILEQRQIPHEYREYPGEGHGFRRMGTRIDALQRETAFYAKVLKFDSV